MINRLFLRHSLKSVLLSEQKTADRNINGDNIRNKEEQLVADWLFLHHVKYKYSEKYEDKYRPSFTIYQKRIIYLDLIVLNKNDTSIYGSQYVRNIKWRRRLHEKNNTIRIEMRSHE